MGTLLPYLWPVNNREIHYRVILALICLFAAKVTTVYVPLFYKEAVDMLSDDSVLVVMIPTALIVGYGIARVLSLGFSELRDALFAKVSQHAIRVISLQVFRHLHSLSLRFHLGRQTGGLSRVIERGNRAIDVVLRFMLFHILPTLFEIALVGVILWLLFNVWFTLITMVTMIGYIAFTLVITEWRIKFRKHMNEADTRANSRAIDSLLNYETVKYFGNEEHEAKRFDESLKVYERAAVKSMTSLSLLNTGQALIIAIGLAGVMYMAAAGIVDGTMSIGDFVLVNTYLIQLYLPLNFFGFAYREIKQALVDIEAMFQLLTVPCEITDRPGTGPLQVTDGAIVFEKVQFGYIPQRMILKDVSFHVPAGQTLAIVGPSGAGKSTISRLLFRFYEIQVGQISIDGQDLRSVTQESVRAAIGIVPQDTVLFNDTIFYNIAYGRVHVTMDEVEHAARLAYIYDFIMSLPEGFDTQVGERGLKLSGGEKQRIAIARTILKNPKILLFDEATSALDTHTEREIQANLAEVSHGHTTLVIAHRLSTIIDADEILVLDDGRIVEQGQHEALLDSNGIYASMWYSQQEDKLAGIGENNRFIKN